MELRSGIREIIKIIEKNNYSEIINELIKFNNKNYIFKSKFNKILIDPFPVPEWIIINTIASKKIAEIENAELESFGFFGRTKKLDSIFESFGCKIHKLVRLNRNQQLIRKQLFFELIECINDKNDLLNYSIEGVNIGLDIYESILRDLQLPTVNIHNYKTYKYYLWGITFYLYFKNLFMLGEYKAVFLSHDSYISMGTVSKVAYRYSVPVFFANAYEIIKTNKPHHIYERLSWYPKIFEKLSDTEKENGIKWAKSQLDDRLHGKVGIGLRHQTISAFTNKILNKQISESQKIKIVIATHCFFDNPHGYGGMLFPDFYEWIKWLIDITRNLNYDLYIKPHPDFLPGTMEILDKLRGHDGTLKIIDPGCSWIQLYNEGVRFVLTCYGSIGHELPLLGYTVVNAGYNPHIAYDFNIHAKTIEDYRSILENLNSINFKPKLNELYEFYYIHKKYTSSADVFIDSYERIINDVNDDNKELAIYTNFLDNKELINSRISIYMDNLIINNKFFIYE